METRTKGNVIVEKIKVGDIHYEYEYGLGIKCKVITKPIFSKKDGGWKWKSKDLKTNKIIDYFVNPEYPQYSVNLYDYEAYILKREL